MKKNNLPIFVVGVSHHTAGLDLRQRLAINPDLLGDRLVTLVSRDGVSEAVVLSTCNRFEIYCSAASAEEITSWISKTFPISDLELSSHTYIHKDLSAVRHVIRVAGGLDSMVLGETQIFGQIKEAYRLAKAMETVGPALHQMFQTAFSVAKDIRSKTEIGRHSVSLSAAIVKASRQIFVDLQHLAILFIGAGEMIRLCADHFSSVAPKMLAFTNRTLSRSKDLATQYNGVAFDMGELARKLPLFDIIVTCTASPLQILGKGSLETALKIRRHKPVALFDLAVPPDTETGIAALDDVFMYSIDDLGNVVQQGMESRVEAVIEAETIIQEGVKNFSQWIKSRETLPALKAYRSHGEAIVKVEYERALVNLRNNKSPEEVLRLMAGAIEKKFLDRPSRALSRADGTHKKVLANSLIDLFDLE